MKCCLVMCFVFGYVKIIWYCIKCGIWIFFYVICILVFVGNRVIFGCWIMCYRSWDVNVWLLWVCWNLSSYCLWQCNLIICYWWLRCVIVSIIINFINCCWLFFFFCLMKVSKKSWKFFLFCCGINGIVIIWRLFGYGKLLKIFMCWWYNWIVWNVI